MRQLVENNKESIDSVPTNSDVAKITLHSLLHSSSQDFQPPSVGYSSTANIQERKKKKKDFH